MYIYIGGLAAAKCLYIYNIYIYIAIYIMNTFDRSSASVEHNWSHMSLLHMKINGIIEKGFCLIKMIEAGYKWNRVILTSPW